MKEKGKRKGGREREIEKERVQNGERMKERKHAK